MAFVDTSCQSQLNQSLELSASSQTGRKLTGGIEQENVYVSFDVSYDHAI